MHRKSIVYRGWDGVCVVRCVLCEVRVCERVCEGVLMWCVVCTYARVWRVEWAWGVW